MESNLTAKSNNIKCNYANSGKLCTELYVQNIHPVRISKSIIRISCMPIFQRKVSSWELRNIGKFFHTPNSKYFFCHKLFVSF